MATDDQAVQVPGPARWVGNLRYARLDRHEVAGSLGDLGTFRPLLVGMAAQNGLDFAAALFFAGLSNVVTGLTFGIPTLNSAIAVCALSRDLFLDRPVSPRKVATSVGLMNLVAGWFSGMPMCHGAGGLAGQYRFGARTNGSILFLGAAKIGAGHPGWILAHGAVKGLPGQRPQRDARL